MTIANRTAFLHSLGQELQCQSRRIRDLIGDAHWLTDGHHKEYLLRGLLRRNLPTTFVLERGFTVSTIDSQSCSKEQDILILECSRDAPLFNEGGVVVTFPGLLLGAISVKTTMSASTISNSIEGLNSVRSIATSSGIDPRTVWCAAFFYEVEAALEQDPSRIGRILSKAMNDFPVRASGIAA